jgi:hypothetical protein
LVRWTGQTTVKPIRLNLVTRWKVWKWESLFLTHVALV